MLVALEDEVDALVHQHVEEVEPDLAALLAGGDAVAGHAHRDPPDPRRTGTVDGVDQPPVMDRARGVVVLGAVGHRDRRGDHDDPHQGGGLRVIEEVLLAVSPGAAHPVGQAGHVLVDQGAVLGGRPGTLPEVMAAGDDLIWEIRADAVSGILDEVAPGRLGIDLVVGHVAEVEGEVDPCGGDPLDGAGGHGVVAHVASGGEAERRRRRQTGRFDRRRLGHHREAESNGEHSAIRHESSPTAHAHRFGAEWIGPSRKPRKVTGCSPACRSAPLGWEPQRVADASMRLTPSLWR